MIPDQVHSFQKRTFFGIYIHVFKWEVLERERELNKKPGSVPVCGSLETEREAAISLSFSLLRFENDRGVKNPLSRYPKKRRK
jgi:hypothetical protein